MRQKNEAINAKDAMKSDAIRSSFLNFFLRRGHRVAPSSGPVPADDPGPPFTGARIGANLSGFHGIDDPGPPFTGARIRFLQSRGYYEDTIRPLAGSCEE